MLKVITILLLISLSFSSLCQYSQNLDGMGKKEIKQFLLEQDNDQRVTELMHKHLNTKRTSNTFFAFGGISLGVGLIAATQANSISDLEVPLVLVSAGLLSSSFGILTAIASSMYFHKAKKQYLEIPYTDTNTSQIIIRNEVEIMNGI